MGRSLAPSPMAMHCAGEMPRREATSNKVRRFSAPSHMSPQAWSTRRPVSWPQFGPLSISSMLARVKSMPSRCLTRSLKNVKPPDTSKTFMPAPLQAWINSAAPGLMRRRSTSTLSMSAMVTPRNKATRRRRLSLKSVISPRIAASVMAATSALRPTASAISSTHSMLMSVESMSKAMSLKSLSRRGGSKP